MEREANPNGCTINEICEKRNTSKMIPNNPMTAPAAHIHSGTAIMLSNTVHAVSGMESAESMLDKGRKGTSRKLLSSHPGHPPENLA